MAGSPLILTINSILLEAAVFADVILDVGSIHSNVGFKKKSLYLYSLSF